jgi:succinyl-CoA synthetase alpha subunit
MGHAGAIITGGKGAVEDKIEALTKAGALVADRPSKVGVLLEQLNVKKS